MTYLEPDKIWAEMELKIMDGMGRQWFIKNPPKIWKLPKKPDDLVLEGMKRELREQLGYQFKVWAPFAHRYMRDLVSEKRKIIIHHWRISADEMRLSEILGYRFYFYNKKNWRMGLETIIEEIRNGDDQSVAR